MGCSSGREALSVQNGLAKKVKNILQLETHSWTRDRSRTTSRLNWISKAYRVNQNMWISRWWRWSWAKRKGTQTKCTVDGGRRLHLQTLIPATLQSDSLWVFSDEVESDKAETLHENTAFFLCSRKSKQPIVYDKLRAFCRALCQACAKLVSLPFSPYRGHSSLLFAAACLANTKEKKWHLLGLSLFVFQLFLHHMSAFMSSLRQNIKEAHSLLILTMTIQSFRNTNFTVCACTFYFKKSGYCHNFLNIPCLLAYETFCTMQAFHFVKWNK